MLLPTRLPSEFPSVNFRMDSVRSGMRVIFLDIDGVMGQGGHPASLEQALLPQHMSHLNELAGDAAFVIISTWRLLQSLEDLRSAFARAGFRGEIVGVTPMCSTREREIAMWMDDNPTAQWAILDDSPDMGALTPQLVCTSPHGLGAEHVARVRQILQSEV